jgi:hypothetical protein
MPRLPVYGAEMRVTCIKLLFAGGLVMSPVSGHTTDAISFAASDRVQVFADYYSACSKAKPLILLFHQAGSNRGEYATIGPRLHGTYGHPTCTDEWLFCDRLARNCRIGMRLTPFGSLTSSSVGRC